MRLVNSLLIAAVCATTAQGQQAQAIRRSGPPADTAATGQMRHELGAAPRAPRAADDAYSQFLYAPELVMRNQAGINLQETQRTKIVSEMAQAQVKFTEIQWSLSGEEEKLNRLLQEPNPTEQAVLAQMDRVLSLEQTLKRTQMTMLVRIKNLLTQEQQTALSRLRRDEPAPEAALMIQRRGGGG